MVYQNRDVAHPTCAYKAHTRPPIKADYNTAARKRPVNLTLNEDWLSQTRELTGNLFNAVETLLASYVREKRRQRADKARAMRTTIGTWNAFDSKSGSYADEYSTL